MEVVPYTGIVKQVIDAVNLAFAEGPLSVTNTIILTRPEMDEFMAKQPFNGGVGKFYGDADVPALMHIEHDANQKVIAFFLAGVKVACKPTTTA